MLYKVLWATMAIRSNVRVVINSKTIKGAEFLRISAQNRIAEEIWNIFKKIRSICDVCEL